MMTNFLVRLAINSPGFKTKIFLTSRNKLQVISLE